ncbi:MAG: SoxR reducing system RseC family protein [Candidatus Omnitrophica bacterium]|nr:SoxR reducing system RseC family protein [Candidatus Omnitrophota bacterium]
MKEVGKIIEVTDKFVVVETDVHEKCSKCCSCQASRGRQVSIRKKRDEFFSIGDKVEIVVETKSMMRVYLLLYAVPLVIFISGVLAAHVITRSPIMSFAAGIAVLILCYAVLSIHIKNRHGFSDEISVKKINPKTVS